MYMIVIRVFFPARQDSRVPHRQNIRQAAAQSSGRSRRSQSAAAGREQNEGAHGPGKLALK